MIKDVEKEYLVGEFGMVLEGVAVPPGYIGEVVKIDDGVVSMLFTERGASSLEGADTVSVEILDNTLRKVIDKKLMEDASDLLKPEHESEYEIGDLVASVAGTGQGIVEGMRYRYKTDSWVYDVSLLGSAFNKTNIGIKFDESELEGVDVLSLEVINKSIKYKMTIERI